MITYSLQIAAISIVYMMILPHEEPFNKWFAFGYKKFANTLIYKVLYQCEKCFAGQMALWFYILFHVKHLRFTVDCLFGIFPFVCQTILITIFISFILKFLQRTCN